MDSSRRFHKFTELSNLVEWQPTCTRWKWITSPKSRHLVCCILKTSGRILFLWRYHYCCSIPGYCTRLYRISGWGRMVLLLPTRWNTRLQSQTNDGVEWSWLVFGFPGALTSHHLTFSCGALSKKKFLRRSLADLQCAVQEQINLIYQPMLKNVFQNMLHRVHYVKSPAAVISSIYCNCWFRYILSACSCIFFHWVSCRTFWTPCTMYGYN